MIGLGAAGYRSPMARPPSDADRDFSKRLQTLGLGATPQRVQTLREVGLLPAPTPAFPGGGGSSGRYPSDLVERAAEALELAHEHHRELHLAVAVMYARGKYSISEAKLKRALLRVLDRYKRELLIAAEDEDKPGSLEEPAIAAGIVLAKRLDRDPEFGEQRRRIARSKTRTKRAVLETVSTSVVQTLLTGEAPHDEAVEEIFRILGFPDGLTKAIVAEPAEQAGSDDFSHFRFDDVALAVKRASLAQLEAVRGDAIVQLDNYRAMEASIPLLFAKSKATALKFPITDETTILAALTNLAAMFNDSDSYEEQIAHVRRMTPFLYALVEFKCFLPAEFKSMVLFDETLHDTQLTTGERQRLNKLKAEYARQYPMQARILGLQLQ